MRIGCSTYSYRQLFADGRMNVYAFLDKAYELGLDGVELLTGMFSTEKEDLIKIKRRAMELGLHIAACTIGCPATTADEAQRAAGMASSKEWVEIANFLGAPALRVDTGGMAQGMELDQAFENCISFFKELAAYSGEYGISLGMENHKIGLLSICVKGAKVNEQVSLARKLLETKSTCFVGRSKTLYCAWAHYF